MPQTFTHPRIYTGRDPSLGPDGALVRQLGIDESGLICTPAKGPATTLPGAAVVPGFIDTHAHLNSLGGGPNDLELRDVSSSDDLLERVSSAAAALPARAWITGTGWQDASWRAPAPGADALSDAAGGRAVALFRRDRHALVASREALCAAGITTRTPDPPGGMIVRERQGVRDRQGRATGLLIDTAMDAVLDAIPSPTPEDIRREAHTKMGHMASLGVTCVHEAFVEPRLWEALAQLAASAEDAIRVRAMLGFEWTEPPRAVHPDRLRAFAIKGFADGALGSRGAQMLSPYHDEETRGIAVQSDAELAARADMALGYGLQLAVHAIGDLGARRVLDLYENVRREGRLPDDARWRIEHAQTVHPDDVRRVAGLGLALQPIHFLADGGWAGQRLGSGRLPWCYRMRSLIDAGGVVGLGSDFPIEGADPRVGVDMAQAASHPLVPSWSRDGERLDRYTALDGYWGRAAWLARDEQRLGRLLPGFHGDFVCLDRDPFECDRMTDARVVATYVAGRQIFPGE